APVALLACRECGLSVVPFDGLRRWAVDLPGFLAALARAGGISGKPGEVVPGRLWRVGKARWSGRTREVFLGRDLVPTGHAAVASALSHHPKGILLLPTETAVRSAAAAVPNFSLALESVLALGGDGL